MRPNCSKSPIPVSIVLALVFASMVVCAHRDTSTDDTIPETRHSSHEHARHSSHKDDDEQLVKPDVDEELDSYSMDDKEGDRLRDEYQRLVKRDHDREARNYRNYAREARRHAFANFMESGRIASHGEGFAFPNQPGAYGYHDLMGSNGHNYYNRHNNGRYYGGGDLDRDPVSKHWTGHMRDPRHRPPTKAKGKGKREAEDEDLVEDSARFGPARLAYTTHKQAELEHGGGFGAGTMSAGMFGSMRQTGPIQYFGHGIFDHRNVGGDSYAYGIHLPFPEAGFPFGHSYFSHGRYYRNGHEGTSAKKLDQYRFGGGFGYGHELPYPAQRLPFNKWEYGNKADHDEEDEE